MTWNEVRQLSDLAALNSKIAFDALDDAVNELVICREKLDHILKLLRVWRNR